MIGKTLGHYQITNQFVKGGMGEVFQARIMSSAAMWRSGGQGAAPRMIQEGSKNCWRRTRGSCPFLKKGGGFITLLGRTSARNS